MRPHEAGCRVSAREGSAALRPCLVAEIEREPAISELPCHKLIITLALAEKVIIAPHTRQPASWPRNPPGRQLCADDAILRDDALNDPDRQRSVYVALKAAARFVAGECKSMAHPPFLQPPQTSSGRRGGAFAARTGWSKPT